MGTNTVLELKEMLSAKFHVWAYRIGLSSEGGDAMNDKSTLEEHGICDGSPPISVIIGEQQKFREMGHEDFIELLLSKGLVGKHRLPVPLERPEQFDDMGFRQKYIPMLHAIEKEEERKRERQEQLLRRKEEIKAKARKLIEEHSEEDALHHLQNEVSAAEALTRKAADDASAIK